MILNYANFIYNAYLHVKNIYNVTLGSQTLDQMYFYVKFGVL